MQQDLRGPQEGGELIGSRHDETILGSGFPTDGGGANRLPSRIVSRRKVRRGQFVLGGSAVADPASASYPRRSGRWASRSSRSPRTSARSSRPGRRRSGWRARGTPGFLTTPAMAALTAAHLAALQNIGGQLRPARTGPRRHRADVRGGGPGRAERVDHRARAGRHLVDRAGGAARREGRADAVVRAAVGLRPARLHRGRADVPAAWPRASRRVRAVFQQGHGRASTRTGRARRRTS